MLLYGVPLHESNYDDEALHSFRCLRVRYDSSGVRRNSCTVSSGRLPRRVRLRESPGSADILHVPVDLVIHGDKVQYARPLFNLEGTRVTGSELGAGSYDTAGTVHVTSEWYVRGIAVRGDYSGTLTLSGGTLSGTQSWRGPEGDAHSRTCEVALVPAPHAKHADSQQ